MQLAPQTAPSERLIAVIVEIPCGNSKSTSEVIVRCVGLVTVMLTVASSPHCTGSGLTSTVVSKAVSLSGVHEVTRVTSSPPTSPSSVIASSCVPNGAFWSTDTVTSRMPPSPGLTRPRAKTTVCSPLVWVAPSGTRKVSSTKSTASPL